MYTLIHFQKGFNNRMPTNCPLHPTRSVQYQVHLDSFHKIKYWSNLFNLTFFSCVFVVLSLRMFHNFGLVHRARAHTVNHTESHQIGYVTVVVYLLLPKYFQVQIVKMANGSTKNQIFQIFVVANCSIGTEICLFQSIK